MENVLHQLALQEMEGKHGRGTMRITRPASPPCDLLPTSPKNRSPSLKGCTWDLGYYIMKEGELT